ncbi:hypothetical protein P6144_15185 [Sphingomonas sp. HITSZ_GF]|uniref:hypothetical protein n=1 Tax=Sphingomonas sp. HITSZ_GF TaxID=3037247 RepID=UPI00240DEFDA|nr:hypothetical protein [Sphingomonas sp. HITSZ_GF]MDG2535002.1 hypothetical protein [Sphingomonas sp. HITSZ_GF]
MNSTKQRLLVAAGTLATFLAGTAVIAQSGTDTAPEARYEMDVGTTAGIMGQSDTREMTLRLGSRLAATGGAPKADHFLPDGMRMGLSVPLTSPEPGKLPVEKQDDPEEKFQRPKGRLLIFWGCGAHAGPGQPVVIDFSKMAKGQIPPDLFSARIPAETGPRPGNSRTYGDWPNGKSRAQVSKQSSLIGQHRIAGNYSPEIAFALTQDFMPPPRVKSGQAPDGSTPLNWSPVPAATGYYAWAMSAKDNGKDSSDMVWWASSSSRQFGGDLWSWLSPATVNRLIGQKIVMPPSQTSCTIPAEVKAAGGEMMMGFMNAFGPEANFAFPERPRDPKIAWHPKWTAKVRYRSTGNFMPGMPSMGEMMMGQQGDKPGDKPEEKPKPCKPKLGGFLKKAAGLGGSGC